MTRFITHQPVGLLGDLLIFWCLLSDRIICPLLDIKTGSGLEKNEGGQRGRSGQMGDLIFHSQALSIALDILGQFISQRGHGLKRGSVL